MSKLRPTREQTLAAAAVIGKHFEPSLLREEPAFELGRPVDTEHCDTFASGMAVRVSIPEAVQLLLEVVDQMVLVGEDNLKEAMGLYLHHTGHLPEGAGAGALAAALQLRPVLEGKTVCLIASGGNVDAELQQEIETHFKPREG
jgi:threonine dehydratase